LSDILPANIYLLDFQTAWVRGSLTHSRYRSALEVVAGTGSLEAWVKKVVVNESLKFLKRMEQHEVLPMDVESLEEVGEEFG
jgi:hypothetical protein